ncbi:hypothetical protein BU14_0816s0005 [Porphyra umbilicalis]|uniref:ZC3H15/TMA46 family C-terminal domain-containing protein n=1 Tax=Porphyra umbilicalis TaxID=2786 RepID=A0A1X6NNY8_PORUM|nr:hypothetical protein BU14_0816s0005 [Porphyra umbilicalis]|eukprot:OSX70285.1 hypothetical protein BU14_0816s0005 [Porphyra umbilicalis]
MPPKKSKKNVEKDRAKTVEDKTFGLKNKNKSKKVQQFVQRVEKQATDQANNKRSAGGGGSAHEAGGTGGKLTKKQMLAARMEELSLFAQPVVDKPKKADEEAAARKKAEEEAELERLRILSLPVEDQIETERAKLKTRTPVTIDAFLAWRTTKRAERAAREKVAAAERLKGLSKAERSRGGGLTGRELFTAHQELFEDDEEADQEVYVPRETVSDSEEEEGAEAGAGEGGSGEGKDDGDDSDAEGAGDASLFS